MKIKLLALLLSILFIISATYAQHHGEHDHDHDHDQHDVQFNAAADDDNDDAEAYQDNQQRIPSQQQQAAVMHELTIICIVVAKYQLNSYGLELIEILTGSGSRQEHDLFFRKVLAEHIQTCLKSINPQDSQQILQELQERTFAIKKYRQYFVELTLERYQNPQFDRVITLQETQILKFLDKFEKNWKDHKEIQEEKEKATGQKRLKPEDQEL